MKTMGLLMNGSDEQTLDIYLGQNVIAKLKLLNDQLHWHYSPLWQQSGYAISPHLPLSADIPSLNIQRFLRNLLPEGSGLDELLSTFHLSKNNTFGLVRALGADTPGALIILKSQQTLTHKSSFRIITNDELEKRLDNRDEFSLIIWDGKPRLSVAGVQDKINVVLNNKNQLGFGDGSLCSTHILKFEKQQLSHLVLNEFITMRLAKRCGLLVANAQLLSFGKHKALLIERFDRKIISLNEVKRRHIIDGCQALNLSPEYKYERNFGSGRDVKHIRDGASLIKLFNFSNQCENPAKTKQQMLDWVLFNILIFNYDAHGKNISFFVSSSGISVAPFYDLVNIKMYPDFEHEMAMELGDEFDGEKVDAYQLADFADSCQLSRLLVTTRLKYIIKKLLFALDNEMTQLISNNEENHYLKKYISIVSKNCDRLYQQANDIASIIC